jgi:capsid protein
VKLDIRQTALDRAIAYFSPAKGLERQAARAGIAATTAMYGSGGYRGADDRRNGRRGFGVRSRSANADIIPGSARLRAEQRDAAMNMPIATAAIGRATTFTVGTGLMAIPSIDADKLGLTPEEKDAWEARIAKDYDAYMSSKDPDAERTATGYQQQDIVFRSTLTDGDVVGLRVLPLEQPGRRIFTAWKLAEADRLVNPPTVADGQIDPETGNKIAGGVEVDAYSAPIAYHVLKQHPGDLNLVQWNPIPERIEAWDTKLNLERVVHPFIKERPEQFRGVGMLATCIDLLTKASDLTEAEAFAAVLTSMVAIIHKSPDAAPLPEPAYGEDENCEPAQAAAQADAPPVNYDLAPGTIWELDTASEVDMKSPGRPNTAFDPFFKALVHQIGAAIGMPGSVLLALFNSSYTASKGELELFYQWVRKRMEWLAANWCKPQFVCWMAEKVARGDYVMPGFFRDLEVRDAWCGVDWRGDGKITLQPLQEAQALAIHEAHAWQTGQQITANLTGGSFRDNVRVRGAEIAGLKEAKIPIPVAPGTSAGAQNTVDAPDGGDAGGSAGQNKDNSA